MAIYGGLKSAASPTPGPSGDQGIAGLLAAGTAGGSYTAGTNPFGGDSGSGQTDSSGNNVIHVGGYTISLDPRVAAADAVLQVGQMFVNAKPVEDRGGIKTAPPGNKVSAPKQASIVSVLQQFNNWTTTQYNAFREQAFNAGLTSTKSASKTEVLGAWQTVVEESVLQKKTPEDLIGSASKNGWSSINPTLQPGDHGLGGSGNRSGQGGSTVTNTTSTTDATTSSDQTTARNTVNNTTYVSYLDPATAQQTLSTTFKQLMGRAPTQHEYQAFLDSLYSYQDKANTGTFETKDSNGNTVANAKTQTTAGSARTSNVTGGPGTGTSSGPAVDTVNTTNNSNANTVGSSSGTTDTNTSIVKQRGVGAGGVDFMAQQQAMSSPEYGQYQAATTYFNALIKALAGPASGMTASN